jgi:hypothetical protein
MRVSTWLFIRYSMVKIVWLYICITHIKLVADHNPHTLMRAHELHFITLVIVHVVFTKRAGTDGHEFWGTGCTGKTGWVETGWVCGDDHNPPFEPSGWGGSRIYYFFKSENSQIILYNSKKNYKKSEKLQINVMFIIFQKKT